MLQLLSTFTLQEILIVIVLLAVAIKGIVSFLDWGYARLKKIFIKEHQAEASMGQIESRFEKDENRVEGLAKEHIQFNQDIAEIKKSIKSLERMNKNDIKAWITKEHHHFTDPSIGWIDDYSLDCIEKRYGDYKNLDGNSFVLDLMQEIRALPKHPPQQ